MYKRLLLYSIDDSVENSIGGRLYPRTEAPGEEIIYSIDDSVENSIGGRLYPRGTETPEKRLYTI